MDPELAGVDGPPALAGVGFWFDNNDAIQLSSWNSLAGVVITLSGRFVHPDGRVEAFVERHVPNTNRTAATAIYPRGVGWLTDLSVIVSTGTPQRGQTFVRVDVVRGQGSPVIVLSTLLQGYCTATKRIAYPTSPIEDSLAGPGAIRSITGTDPAAGAEVSETVPTGARWRPVSLIVTLVSSTVAGNRQSTIIFDDGTNTYFRQGTNSTQALSTTVPWCWADGIGVNGAPGGANTGPLPVGPLLAAGHRIKTLTLLLDAADNYGAPQYEVEEWLEAI